MKIKFLFGLLTLTILILPFTATGQSIKVILDTDMDSDVDDVGAMAMLHTLANNKVLEILGVIVTSDDKYAPTCTDAINHYYKRANIPVGVQKNISLKEFSKYTRQISEEFKHKLKSYNDAEDAVDLYRRLLSSQPDSSITIITIGHLTNLAALLDSKPDMYSPLNGVELIRKKVKL
jgi:inosine-uridine nucleoside N-ribohydrolase